MTVLLIVFLSFIAYLFIAFLVSYISDLFRLQFYRRSAKEKTDPFVKNNIGLVTVITGIQGAGKSTMASAISNIQTKFFKKDAESFLVEFRIKFPEIDFSELDALLRLCFSKKKYNTDFIIAFIFQNNSYYSSLFSCDKFYDDGINHISNLEMFRDYIDAYIAMLRNNYVYYINSQFYNRVTKNYALPLLHDSTAIKDRYLSKDYNIYRYSLIYEDEILLGGGSNTNYLTEAKEDPGYSAFLRIIRHIGKEHIKYLICAQDFERISKERRELATGILDIYQRREKVVKKLALMFYKALYAVFNYWIKFLIDGFPDYAEKFLYGKDRVRKTLNKLYMKIQYLSGFNYLVYSGIRYTNAIDYKKAVSACTYPAAEFRLFFPVVYCYGSINTFEYSSVQDVLSYESRDNPRSLDIDPYPSMAKREDYAVSLLKKRKKSKEESLNVYNGESPP